MCVCVIRIEYMRKIQKTFHKQTTDIKKKNLYMCRYSKVFTYRNNGIAGQKQRETDMILLKNSSSIASCVLCTNAKSQRKTRMNNWIALFRTRPLSNALI